MAAMCPECDSDIDVEKDDVDIGDELSCPECGALLRIAGESPLELELADDDEDDDEDEDDDGEEEDEEEDEDEDGEDEEEWNDRDDEQ